MLVMQADPDQLSRGGGVRSDALQRTGASNEYQIHASQIVLQRDQVGPPYYEPCCELMNRLIQLTVGTRRE